MEIQLTDNSEEFIRAMKEAELRAMERCGEQAEGYAKDLCPVDTGNLRTNITHQVDEAEPAVYVGTNVEYGVYVEMGTGTYTAGGRPTPWVYQDASGHWHRTSGSKAQPYIKPAVADHAQTYRNIIEEEFKSE